jgi:hypothetical protein
VVSRLDESEGGGERFKVTYFDGEWNQWVPAGTKGEGGWIWLADSTRKEEARTRGSYINI